MSVPVLTDSFRHDSLLAGRKNTSAIVWTAEVIYAGAGMDGGNGDLAVFCFIAGTSG
jgi:hypothetical protein